MKMEECAVSPEAGVPLKRNKAIKILHRDGPPTDDQGRKVDYFGRLLTEINIKNDRVRPIGAEGLDDRHWPPLGMQGNYKDPKIVKAWGEAIRRDAEVLATDDELHLELAKLLAIIRVDEVRSEQETPAALTEAGAQQVREIIDFLGRLPVGTGGTASLWMLQDFVRCCLPKAQAKEIADDIVRRSY